jgi:hypothetical protein
MRYIHVPVKQEEGKVVVAAVSAGAAGLEVGFVHGHEVGILQQRDAALRRDILEVVGLGHVRHIVVVRGHQQLQQVRARGAVRVGFAVRELIQHVSQSRDDLHVLGVLQVARTGQQRQDQSAQHRHGLVGHRTGLARQQLHRLHQVLGAIAMQQLQPIEQVRR